MESPFLVKLPERVALKLPSATKVNRRLVHEVVLQDRICEGLHGFFPHLMVFLPALASVAKLSLQPCHPSIRRSPEGSGVSNGPAVAPIVALQSNYLHLEL
jgi:hypothetical protein